MLTGTHIGECLKIGVPEGARFTNSKKVMKFLQNLIGNEDIEYALVISLLPDYTITSIRVVAVGDLYESVVSLKNIFRGAFIDGASGIIFVHNHPGLRKVTPSRVDWKLVRGIQKAGSYLDIALVDSIIISGENWRSMFAKKNEGKKNVS